ncbi:ATP-binding cassette domain-containing protein [Streptomyces sp. uw30]|uniref:ATP-binding cassette domain-containing protein n=1 Tax=Streptomyces sp. uw30 TaxID=1828179 RepID=UPI003967A942
MPTDALLSVRDLRIAFDGVEAVRGLSFDVRPREVLAIVGESGAGKSLTARALLGMLPKGATTSGTIRPDLTAHRGRRISLVPQDALSALSPVHPVGDQLAAAVRSVARVSRKEARARAVAALDRVGIPDAGRKARAYPHEYSGGMRQRAVIAMATVNEPEIVVADEPTTALDEEHRDQVLRVLAEQREAVGAALVLVTHDMDVVREHADRLPLLGQHSQHLVAVLLVQRGRRLVGDDDLGLVDRRHGDHGALPHAAGGAACGPAHRPPAHRPAHRPRRARSRRAAPSPRAARSPWTPAVRRTRHRSKWRTGWWPATAGLKSRIPQRSCSRRRSSSPHEH